MKRLSKSILLLASIALAITGLMRFAALVAPDVTLTVQAQAVDKDKLTARLIELESTISDLKHGAARSPKISQLELDAAIAEYDAISAQMGGDRAPVKAEGKIPAPNAPTGSGFGVVPPAATGCVLTTTDRNQSFPTAIPTGPAVVSSTLAVAGAGPVIWDVNLRTFITHTFNADLDITIQSPAGTVVTLTTDNGAGDDDVFNGTVWDDDANPAGQVPYVTNNGLVTDHAYVNLTLASPLVPEEAMAAFRGEDPNGTWTITISDDLAGDGGSLTSWDLEITTLPAAPTTATTSATNSTPLAIPTGPAVVSNTVAVAGAGTTIHNIRLTTNLTHTLAEDLDITLASPAGTVVTLTTDGAGKDNVFNGTLWDDDANPAGQVPYTTNNGLATDHAYVNLTLASPLVAEEAMGAFIGEDPNGTWTITISDDLADNGGSLASWTLEVTTSTCAVVACTITCPANITVSNDPNQCGAVVNYPPPTTTGDCGTVTCSPASGSFFPVGTTTVTCTATAGPTCTFTVTVNDTQPPTITCPANVTAVAALTCPATVSTVVEFPPPTASDNCPGVTVQCTPPSGSVFPVGTTTVTCTATDASGNTATCSFTISVFDVCLQDDSNPTTKLLINTFTGQYRFFCLGTIFTGVGKVSGLGCDKQLIHNPADRKVRANWSSAVKRGNAAIQSPPGTQRCTIGDRDMTDNDCSTGLANGGAQKPGKK
jgi:subtilisin-like proprotein convertase family protein